MKGVLGKISWRSITPSERRPCDLRRAILRQSAAYDNLPLEFLEYETAREILGEVFNTTPSDVDEMIRRTLEHIDQKRADLGLPAYDATKFGRSGDARMLQLENLPLSERREAIYGLAAD